MKTGKTVMEFIGLSDSMTEKLTKSAEEHIKAVGAKSHIEGFINALDKRIEEKEKTYIPQYRNMSVDADHRLYNKCMDFLNALHSRWYGTAYGVTHGEVRFLCEKIKRGETTFTKFRRSFNESCLRQNLGLGPNDPLPMSKKKIDGLKKYTIEELEQEIQRRKNKMKKS